MVYVALLRGINVGGNNKVDMKLLKQTFERAGLSKVITYINTGNIIFASDGKSKEELVSLLEDAILADFSLSIKVLIRDIDDYETVMRALPTSWTNDTSMKSDVMFLWEEADDESVLDNLSIKPDIDHVIYAPGAVLWSIDRAHATRSGMSKLIGTKLYKLMTIRNVNTTRKIFELMQNAAASS